MACAPSRTWSWTCLGRVRCACLGPHPVGVAGAAGLSAPAALPAAARPLKTGEGRTQILDYSLDSSAVTRTCSRSRTPAGSCRRSPLRMRTMRQPRSARSASRRTLAAAGKAG